MAGKKLPRRTMSMAKRASGTAEAAADLDVVENAIGTPEDDGPDGAPRFDHALLFMGWALAVAGIVAVLITVKVLFAGVDADFSLLPDGYRQEVGLEEEPVDVDAQPDGATAQVTTVDTHSPFAEARTSEPIILDVDCPPDTVEISTGPLPVDTVCIRGQLAEPIAQLTPAAVEVEHVHRIIVESGDRSTIGGQPIPDGLHCQEDEAIGFDSVPDTLFCIHAEPDNVPDGK